VTFAVIAGHGSHWARLRALATSEEGVKHGDVKLTYSVREKKWYAIVAYSEPAPVAPANLDPDVVMVVHRGQRNLLVAATNRGNYSVLATGSKLRSFKRRMMARRHDMQNVTRAERGGAAHGHGRKRRYELPERLSEREANFVKTLCQQMGARVVQLAKHWGAGTIVIEDYGGIDPDKERGKRQALERFPNQQLRTCIEWSLRKVGLKLGTYEHRFMSQTCPQCGNVEATQHNLRTGVFHCRNCSFDRPVDVVSAIFALRQACDGYAGVWEERLSSERVLAQKLKGG
jgi:IS605 OrfB family transposase